MLIRLPLISTSRVKKFKPAQWWLDAGEGTRQAYLERHNRSRYHNRATIETEEDVSEDDENLEDEDSETTEESDDNVEEDDSETTDNTEDGETPIPEPIPDNHLPILNRNNLANPPVPISDGNQSRLIEDIASIRTGPSDQETRIRLPDTDSIVDSIEDDLRTNIDDFIPAIRDLSTRITDRTRITDDLDHNDDIEGESEIDEDGDLVPVKDHTVEKVLALVASAVLTGVLFALVGPEVATHFQILSLEANQQYQAALADSDESTRVPETDRRNHNSNDNLQYEYYIHDGRIERRVIEPSMRADDEYAERMRISRLLKPSYGLYRGNNRMFYIENGVLKSRLRSESGNTDSETREDLKTIVQSFKRWLKTTNIQDFFEEK